MKPIQILIASNDEKYKNHSKRLLKNYNSIIDIITVNTIADSLTYLKEPSAFKLLVLKPAKPFNMDAIENISLLEKCNLNLKVLLFQKKFKIRTAIINAGTLYCLKDHIKVFSHIDIEEILDTFKPKKL